MGIIGSEVRLVVEMNSKKGRETAYCLIMHPRRETIFRVKFILRLQWMTESKAPPNSNNTCNQDRIHPWNRTSYYLLVFYGDLTRLVVYYLGEWETHRIYDALLCTLLYCCHLHTATNIYDYYCWDPDLRIVRCCWTGSPDVAWSRWSSLVADRRHRRCRYQAPRTL